MVQVNLGNIERSCPKREKLNLGGESIFTQKKCPRAFLAMLFVVGNKKLHVSSMDGLWLPTICPLET